MSCTWVIVANSTLARFFQVEKTGELKEIETLIHPESRLHARDLVSERPGRAYESANSARHAIEPATSPKELEFELFAKQVADYLNKAVLDKKFDRLWLSASPHFLGLLRQAITPNTSHALIATIDKDMTQLTPAKIREQMTAKA